MEARGSVRRRACIVVLAALFSAVSASRVMPQPRSAAEPALKAAILFNLARFISWPADTLASGAPLTVCVIDDALLADALAATVKGRSVDGHAVAVSTTPPAARACQLLYVAGDDPGAAIRIADSVRDASVATVSDAPDFAQRSGMMRLFVDGGRMHLRVNLDAVRRARVQVSSQLLNLAEVTRDHAYDPRH